MLKQRILPSLKIIIFIIIAALLYQNFIWANPPTSTLSPVSQVEELFPQTEPPSTDSVNNPWLNFQKNTVTKTVDRVSDQTQPQAERNKLTGTQNPVLRSLNPLWKKTLSYAMIQIGIFAGIFFTKILLLPAMPAVYIIIPFLVSLPFIVIFAIFQGYFLALLSLVSNPQQDEANNNSTHYANQPVDVPANKPWLSHSFLIPIYEESWETIRPTLEAAIVATKNYQQTSGQLKANVVVCDDALMKWTNNDPWEFYQAAVKKRTRGQSLNMIETEILTRMDFYQEHHIHIINIVTARPKHQPGNYERTSLFGKPSNLNYTLKLAERIETIQKQGYSYDETLQLIKNDPNDNRYRNLFLMGKLDIGEIITFLDNDSLAPANAVKHAVSFFMTEENLAYLQNYSEVINRDRNFLTRAVAWFFKFNWKNLHHIAAKYGLVRFHGHNGSVRKKVLQQIGFFSEDQISDDFHTTMRIVSQVNPENGKRYYGKFVAIDNNEYGEGIPVSLIAYQKMLGRYSYGNARLLFNPIRLWLSKGILTDHFKDFLTAAKVKISEKVEMLFMLTYFLWLSFCIITPYAFNICNLIYILFAGYIDLFLVMATIVGNLVAFLIPFYAIKAAKSGNGNQANYKQSFLSLLIGLATAPEALKKTTYYLLGIKKVNNATQKGSLGGGLLSLVKKITEQNVFNIFLGLLYMLPLIITAGFFGQNNLLIIILSLQFTIGLLWLILPYLLEPELITQLKQIYQTKTENFTRTVPNLGAILVQRARAIAQPLAVTTGAIATMAILLSLFFLPVPQSHASQLREQMRVECSQLGADSVSALVACIQTKQQQYQQAEILHSL